MVDGRSAPLEAARPYTVQGQDSSILKRKSAIDNRQSTIVKGGPTPRDVKNEDRTGYMYENTGELTKCDAQNAAFYTKIRRLRANRQHSVGLMGRKFKNCAIIRGEDGPKIGSPGSGLGIRNFTSQTQDRGSRVRSSAPSPQHLAPNASRTHFPASSGSSPIYSKVQPPRSPQSGPKFGLSFGRDDLLELPRLPCEQEDSYTR
jgi:hypothetical protein